MTDHSGQVAKRGEIMTNNIPGDVAPPEYTADQIAQGIINALAAHDVHAVPPLIQMLALRDPQLAQDVLDVITRAVNGDRDGAEKMALIADLRRTL